MNDWMWCWYKKVNPQPWLKAHSFDHIDSNNSWVGVSFKVFFLRTLLAIIHPLKTAASPEHTPGNIGERSSQSQTNCGFHLRHYFFSRNTCRSEWRCGLNAAGWVYGLSSWWQNWSQKTKTHLNDDFSKFAYLLGTSDPPHFLVPARLVFPGGAFRTFVPSTHVKNQLTWPMSKL